MRFFYCPFYCPASTAEVPRVLQDEFLQAVDFVKPRPFPNYTQKLTPPSTTTQAFFKTVVLDHYRYHLHLQTGEKQCINSRQDIGSCICIQPPTMQPSTGLMAFTKLISGVNILMLSNTYLPPEQLRNIMPTKCLCEHVARRLIYENALTSMR